MKNTGIVRKVDELGRVVIPIEVRRVLEIEEKDPLEVYVDQDRIILRKYQIGCTICGDKDQDTLYNLDNNKKICDCCVNKIARTAGLI